MWTFYCFHTAKSVQSNLHIYKGVCVSGFLFSVNVSCLCGIDESHFVKSRTVWPRIYDLID